MSSSRVRACELLNNDVRRNHMNNCEFLKQENENGLTIWIDIDQPFDDSVFFEALKSFGGLEILEKKCVFKSLGPAELIEEITTNQGKFMLSKQFEDMCSGIDIYSENNELMKLIFNSLSQSSSFCERGNPSKPVDASQKMRWWHFGKTGALTSARP
jgi:hypothetical protein